MASISYRNSWIKNKPHTFSSITKSILMSAKKCHEMAQSCTFSFCYIYIQGLCGLTLNVSFAFVVHISYTRWHVIGLLNFQKVYIIAVHPKAISTATQIFFHEIIIIVIYCSCFIAVVVNIYGRYNDKVEAMAFDNLIAMEIDRNNNQKCARK